jgi:hypothetical protein
MIGKHMPEMMKYNNDTYQYLSMKEQGKYKISKDPYLFISEKGKHNMVLKWFYF